MKKKLFVHGLNKKNPAWEELFGFMDKKEFSVLDMLACVCAVLCRFKDTEFKTTLGCGGWVWDINIKKKKNLEKGE